MDPKHLSDLSANEARGWWHVAKRALATQLLNRFAPPPARLLEGGVGGGMMLSVLQEQGYNVMGLDVSPAAVEHCRALGVTNVHVHDLGTPWTVAPHSMDAVLLLDVIEHLEDPVRVLGFAREALSRRGVVILTVPALPFLFGPWDRMLGHLRRYTVPLLSQHATQAGLRMRWNSHWNTFTLAPAIVTRTYERFTGRSGGAEFPRIPDVVNSGLRLAAYVESQVIQRARLPVGLSIAAVLEVE